MRKLPILLILASAPIFLSAQSNPVLVELFTSQGCSSCPPADAVLRELVKKYPTDQLVALSFHVDYWNRLGWKDPYSRAEFSQRQRTYAAVLEGGVYTPELVINGRQNIVGSKGGEVNGAVEKSLREPSKSIGLSGRATINGLSISVKYQAWKTPENTRIALALIQKTAQNDVPAGENRGEQLSHVNVVIDWQEQALSENGEFSVQLPSGKSSDGFRLALIVQDAQTFAVLAAQYVD